MFFNKTMNVLNLGQVFTPESIALEMIKLIQNKGKVLEPSCGDGVFLSLLNNIIGIEIDTTYKLPNVLNIDFFEYPTENKFETIIGNPPYVAYKNIFETTKRLLPYPYDQRTNLYVFFIRKSIEHLTENGELIFITPREFINSTSSKKLNNFLFKKGTITHWFEFGDQKIFKDATPNVVIWRFEKNKFTRKTETNNGVKNFTLMDGKLMFLTNDYPVKFKDLFYIKVGAVSGADHIFEHPDGTPFVCSTTKREGTLRHLLYNTLHEHLIDNKEILLNRKVKRFDETNWYSWGRGHYISNDERIYVNCITRDTQPFFTHKCKNYDGSILAIFPKYKMDISNAIKLLNNVDWEELGFKVGGRLFFAQKSLEDSILPKDFISL